MRMNLWEYILHAYMNLREYTEYSHMNLLEYTTCAYAHTGMRAASGEGEK